MNRPAILAAVLALVAGPIAAIGACSHPHTFGDNSAGASPTVNLGGVLMSPVSLSTIANADAATGSMLAMTDGGNPVFSTTAAVASPYAPNNYRVWHDAGPTSISNALDRIAARMADAGNHL